LLKVEFSRLALADLKAISRYTTAKWGADQALRYVDEIQECTSSIAESPRIGRLCNAVKPECRCIEQGRHVIFYRQRSETIVISRILHQRMLPKRHVIE
jgi:toxin ParE1/3/4